MANFRPYNKQLNAHDYVDKAISNILDINIKIVEKEDIDLDKLKQLKLLFINELENICIGAGLLSVKKRKFDFDNMSEKENVLYEAALDYYKDITQLQGAPVVQLARSLIKETVEGGYKNKIENARLALIKQAEEEKKSDDWIEMQLANYKVQLILREITNRKPSNLEIDVL